MRRVGGTNIYGGRGPLDRLGNTGAYGERLTSNLRAVLGLVNGQHFTEAIPGSRSVINTIEVRGVIVDPVRQELRRRIN